MELDIFYYSNYNYSILFQLEGQIKMGNSKNVRLIDGLGRVVLPAEARDAMDWAEKTPVDIWVNVAGQELVIKRHSNTCVFCAETENLKEFQKKYICPACRKALSAL